MTTTHGITISLLTAVCLFASLSARAQTPLFQSELLFPPMSLNNHGSCIVECPNGDLLASKSLYVERATGNARVFYRLRVAGFENTDQTRRMCEALRARGVDCIPVTLQ